MWHKAEWMGRQMRLELTRVRLLVSLANRYTTRGAPIYEALYFDEAQGRENGAPKKTRTHSCRFASQAC